MLQVIGVLWGRMLNFDLFSIINPESWGFDLAYEFLSVTVIQYNVDFWYYTGGIIFFSPLVPRLLARLINPRQSISGESIGRQELTRPEFHDLRLLELHNAWHNGCSIYMVCLYSSCMINCFKIIKHLRSYILIEVKGRSELCLSL